jgi:hemerythrin-like domain-containing protein
VNDLKRQTSRKLYEEHVAVIGLLGRFEGALARLRDEPPAADDPVWSTLLAQLDTALQYEITRHFDLEETQLFPLLRAGGEGDLAGLLFEEHESIRAVATPLIKLIKRARTGLLEAEGWQALKVSGLEMAERLGSHAEKEQGALLPVVDELLDEETDMEIWNNYVS